MKTIPSRERERVIKKEKARSFVRVESRESKRKMGRTRKGDIGGGEDGEEGRKGVTELQTESPLFSSILFLFTSLSPPRRE